MNLLTDNPVKTINKDLFRLNNYVEPIQSLILEAESLPLSIGIFGNWRSGKTSFMRMLQSNLNDEKYNKRIKTIWFNPWKYDKKEDLCNALIQTIVGEILESNRLKKTGDIAKELLAAVD
jgi:predicted KAP-like P-loop ATPase